MYSLISFIKRNPRLISLAQLSKFDLFFYGGHFPAFKCEELYGPFNRRGTIFLEI